MKKMMFVLLCSTLLCSTLLCPTLLLAGERVGSLETARSLLEQSRYDEARPILERALEDQATRPEATVLLTWLYNGLGDWEHSVHYGEQAIKLAPNNPMAHHQYAIALRIRMMHISKVRAIFSLGDYRDALARAIELDPGNVDARVERIGFLINAPGIAGGDREQGAKEIEELKAVDWRMGMHMSAELKVLEDRPEQAVAIFEKMIARTPTDYQAYLDLGLLLQDLERYREAAGRFSVIIEASEQAAPATDETAAGGSDKPVNPTLVLSAHYQRADSRIEKRFDLDGAVADLQTYLAGPDPLPSGLPSRSDAWYLLGRAHEALGHRSEARAAYSRAVELDSSNKKARKALGALD